MIDYQQARQIALDRIGHDCALYEDSILEKPYGWVFSFNSRRFLETGDVGDMLVGSAGFVVERENGRVFGFGSAYPLEVWIANYEKGFRYDRYDLTITSVRDLSTTVRLLHRLRMAYVIPEEEHGVKWRIAKNFTPQQLAALLERLPLTFRAQSFAFRVDVFDEIDLTQCCKYALGEYLPDEEADRFWSLRCEVDRLR
jgi:hypothetical protein